MSSQLMLRWAPNVKQAFLGIQCMEYSGITAFMAAATCLTKARLMFPQQYLRNANFARTSIKVYYCEKCSHNLFGQLRDAAELSSNMATLWLNSSFSEQLEAWLLPLSCMSSLVRVTIHAYKMPELQSTVVLCASMFCTFRSATATSLSKSDRCCACPSNLQACACVWPNELSDQASAAQSSRSVGCHWKPSPGRVNISPKQVPASERCRACRAPAQLCSTVAAEGALCCWRQGPATISCHTTGVLPPKCCCRCSRLAGLSTT